MFTAPKKGIYQLSGNANLTREEGGGPNYIKIYRLNVTRCNVVSSLRYRRSQPEPIAINLSLFLDVGEQIAIVPDISDNCRANISLENVQMTYSPADLAPSNFVDGVAPQPTPAIATSDSTPQKIVEGEQIWFPDDANVADVTKAPWNAKGDGKTDDTAAINKALSKGGTVFLPNGVYLVTDQLKYSSGARVPSRTTLQGQSIKGTIIKLRDRQPDFGDPKTPFAVLWTAKFPPQAFQNHVFNLTLDTGLGNPGAIGIQFYANNQGSIENVRIISGDRQGPIGLDLGFSDDQGPMLARHIEVEGFDVGIRCARPTTVTTLEGITVRNQNQVGFLNEMHCVVLKDFSSSNTCTAFKAIDPAAYSLIVDATLTCGQGSQPDASCPGIINQGGMFLRNILTPGYKIALNSKGVDLQQIPTEWTSHPPLTLWPESKVTSLNLPIMSAPSLPWGTVDSWISAKAGGPKIVDTGLKRRGQVVTYEDWTESIRSAMGAGKSTVYFPKGQYFVDGEIRVPANVKRVIGLGSSFSRNAGKAVFIVEDGSDPVHFERWDWNYSKVYIQHRGKRTVVLSNMLGGKYVADAGAGDAFFDDCCQGGVEFVAGQKIWMRQFNPEYGDKPKVINSGADLWILGIKTEGYSTMLVTKDSGRTEILGGMCYANQSHDAEAMFINFAPSSFSCSLAEWVLRSERFEELVIEKQENGVRVLSSKDVPSRGNSPLDKPLGGYGTSSMIPLFVGQDNAVKIK